MDERTTIEGLIGQSSFGTQGAQELRRRAVRFSARTIEQVLARISGLQPPPRQPSQAPDTAPQPDLHPAGALARATTAAQGPPVSTWDPGLQYLWSEAAVRVLSRLGIENWEAVITKVHQDYDRERMRGIVRDPERLARTMIRNAGLAALRTSAFRREGARRRVVLEVPIERRDPVSGGTASPVDEQARLWTQAPEAMLDELRNRLRSEEEAADHRVQLEQMRRRFGRRLLDSSDVTCPLHERSCPQPAKVLASAQGMITSLDNALHEQEIGAWEPRADRLHGQDERDQLLHQRLLHLASAAAHALDPVTYGERQGGRQARARIARCVLYAVWFEARAVEFKYLADQARVTIGWVYSQQLRRQGISVPARRRLLGWLAEHGEPPNSEEVRR